MVTTHSIYLLVSPSGKKYVGQTKNLTRRLNVYQRGKGGKQRALRAAIEKYGFDSFTVTTLAEGLSRAEVDAAEMRFILSEGSKAPHGYNLTDGGEDGVLAEESVEIIRGKMRRKYADPAERKKVSDRQKAFYSGKALTEGELAELARRGRTTRERPESLQRIREGQLRKFSDPAKREEVSRRMRAWHAARRASPELAAQYAAKVSGRKKTAEEKAAISQRLRQQWASGERKASPSNPEKIKKLKPVR